MSSKKPFGTSHPDDHLFSKLSIFLNKIITGEPETKRQFIWWTVCQCNYGRLEYNFPSMNSPSMQIFQGTSNCLIPLSVVQTAHLLARQGALSSGSSAVYRSTLKKSYIDFPFQLSTVMGDSRHTVIGLLWNLERLPNYFLVRSVRAVGTNVFERQISFFARGKNEKKNETKIRMLSDCFKEFLGNTR